MQGIKNAIQAACKELFNTDVEVVLTRPDEQFGDYATNVALQLAKRLGKNPREVAEEIAVKIRENLTDKGELYAEAKNDKSLERRSRSWPEAIKLIKSVDVAGPGFINIHLTDEALVSGLDANQNQQLAGKTVLVEYSDPNPLKPLHAGHLYTTLVGDAIARLVENAGARTVRLNYGGDVGRHIGISLWAIIHELGGENPGKLAEIAEADRPSWLGARYVEGTAAFEEDETAKAEILVCNKKVYELHASSDHESPFAQIYWTVRQWSYDYFTVLYDQLGVVPFDRFIPESEVTPLGVQTVTAHMGDVYERSEGAVVFRGEPHGSHTRVFINSEGLPTYEAKDVGLLLTKWNDYNFDTSIVITANEQAQYMQVMLKSVEQFEPEPVHRTIHLTHGIVKLAGGVKMSSRKGNIISALDILDAARTAGEQSGKANDDTVTIAAVKYAFLKNRIGADVIYDPAESITLEGNSGPYLQYAHARAKSILSKSADSNQAQVEDLQAGERSLVRKLTEYQEVVSKATSELVPHLICTYLYELAQTFNRFYEQNRVIGDEREAVRLALVNKYADTLKSGLSLLGIEAPERM